MSYKRSHEPIVWSLFGAGGVVSAFLLPAVMLTFGILFPLGLLDADALSYERVIGFASSWFGKVILFSLICFPLWHGMHRIYHGMHDVGLPHNTITYVIFYGIAFVTSIVAGSFLFVL